jgi:hypothetical protein
MSSASCRTTAFIVDLLAGPGSQVSVSPATGSVGRIEQRTFDRAVLGFLVLLVR